MEEWLLQSLAREREQLQEIETLLPEWLNGVLRQVKELSTSQPPESSDKR